MFLEIAVQQLFKEAFVSEGGEIITRSKFVKNRQRDSPGHPLPRHLRQIPATTKKRFHYLDLGFSETVQTRGEVYRFERSTQRRIADRRGEDFGKGRRFFFAFADDN